MSYPAYFSSGPKEPPELEAAMVPVRGPFVTTSYRPPEGAKVPEKGPGAKISLFSGERGSTRASTSSV